MEPQVLCECSQESRASEAGQLALAVHLEGIVGQPWAWVMARVRDQIQDQFLVGPGPKLAGINPKSRPSVGTGPGLPGTGLRVQPVTRVRPQSLHPLVPHSGTLTHAGLWSSATFTQSECTTAPGPHSCTSRKNVKVPFSRNTVD